MKRMILPKGLSCPGHEDDVNRVVDICLDNGYKIESHVVENIWAQYSEDYYAASWLGMDAFEDREIFEILFDRTDQVEEWER